MSEDELRAEIERLRALLGQFVELAGGFWGRGIYQEGEDLINEGRAELGLEPQTKELDW